MSLTLSLTRSRHVRFVPAIRILVLLCRVTVLDLFTGVCFAIRRALAERSDVVVAVSLCLGHHHLGLDRCAASLVLRLGERVTLLRRSVVCLVVVLLVAVALAVSGVVRVLSVALSIALIVTLCFGGRIPCKYVACREACHSWTGAGACPSVLHLVSSASSSSTAVRIPARRSSTVSAISSRPLGVHRLAAMSIVARRARIVVIVVNHGLSVCSLARRFLDFTIKLLGTTAADKHRSEHEKKRGGDDPDDHENTDDSTRVFEERFSGRALCRGRAGGSHDGCDRDEHAIACGADDRRADGDRRAANSR